MEKNSKDFKKIIKLKYPEYIGTKDLEKFQKQNKNKKQRKKRRKRGKK